MHRAIRARAGLALHGVAVAVAAGLLRAAMSGADISCLADASALLSRLTASLCGPSSGQAEGAQMSLVGTGCAGITVWSPHQVLKVRMGLFGDQRAISVGKYGGRLYAFVRDAKQRRWATRLKSSSNGAGFATVVHPQILGYANAPVGVAVMGASAVKCNPSCAAARPHPSYQGEIQHCSMRPRGPGKSTWAQELARCSRHDRFLAACGVAVRLWAVQFAPVGPFCAAWSTAYHGAQQLLRIPWLLQ